MEKADKADNRLWRERRIGLDPLAAPFTPYLFNHDITLPTKLTMNPVELTARMTSTRSFMTLKTTMALEKSSYLYSFFTDATTNNA